MIWDELEFFEKKEFDCKCGCGGNQMNHDFLKKLDDFRGRLGFPLVVTSGYRCPDYNERVSTTKRNGPHTTGRAVDVNVFGRQAFAAVRQASLGGWFSGIGINQRGAHHKRFIHLDDLEPDDGRFRPTLWTY